MARTGRRWTTRSRSTRPSNSCGAPSAANGVGAIGRCRGPRGTTTCSSRRRGDAPGGCLAPHEPPPGAACTISTVTRRVTTPTRRAAPRRRALRPRGGQTGESSRGSRHCRRPPRAPACLPAEQRRALSAERMGVLAKVVAPQAHTPLRRPPPGASPRASTATTLMEKATSWARWPPLRPAALRRVQ